MSKVLMVDAGMSAFFHDGTGLVKVVGCTMMIREKVCGKYILTTLFIS